MHSKWTGGDWSKGQWQFTSDIYQPFIYGWHAELYRALEALEDWPNEAMEERIRKLVAFYERDQEAPRAPGEDGNPCRCARIPWLNIPNGSTACGFVTLSSNPSWA